MNEICRPEFEESLLSGFVDNELTQADQQRVRLHLEECAECRDLVDRMRQIREAAAATPFAVPADGEWQELPRSAGSLWTRRVGWLLLAIGLLGAGWLAARGLIEGSESWYQRALFFSLAGGILLLFGSVLLDRLKALKSDHYRGVQK